MVGTKYGLFLRQATIALAIVGLTVASAHALPPAPPNDAPANAEILGPTVPLVVYGTTVLANNSISSVPGLGGLPAGGPDVFYSFTPTASETYRVQLLPWQKAPLRSSDREFTIYLLDGNGNGVAGNVASGSARPVHFSAALIAGETYTLGVDHEFDSAGRDNFPFTLMVDTLPATAPNDCATAEPVGPALPVVALNDIDGASADFTYIEEGGLCAVANFSNGPGIDHVYKFTPPVDGEYAIEVAAEGFNAIIYVNETCPPSAGGCLGSSNHTIGGGGKHELLALSLLAGQDYYVYVDNTDASSFAGSYALVIDEAFVYEMTEAEPNDTLANATPVAPPLNGGQLVGPSDIDVWSVTGMAGDRVYAWVNNGGSSNSTLDTDLAFLAPGGALIEFDDEDADGADAPIQDLRYIYATSAPVIAGAQLVADDTHYFEVTKQNAGGTVHRYRFHVGVEPGSRSPLDECEPNDSLASADLSGKHYYRGAITRVDDSDFFAFKAQAGERVFIAADGDPERDSTGFSSPNDDPNAFNPKLVIYDPDGDVLISDVSDSNSIQSAPDYPAQGAFFVAREEGTHYVEVRAQGSSSQVGPTETYELAIFLDAQAPQLTEDVDPVLSLQPDYVNNVVMGTATDDLPGDSGLCGVELVASDNLQITNLNLTPGAPSVTFDIEPVNPANSGFGKLRVTDCAGNTACEIVRIDAVPPVCSGFNFSQRLRGTLEEPIHIPDNKPEGAPGSIEISESGLITDVNVTVTVHTLDPADLDIFLISPAGTSVELVTDRMSSLAIDMIDATFDDDADEIMPILSSLAPYTGTWLPEDPAGLAQLNGEDAQGIWQLLVIDDSPTENFGATLSDWSLDIEASFAGPETFQGLATDEAGFDSGIAALTLTNATNLQLNVPPEFVPGDPSVAYTVTLIDPTTNGSGTVVAEDMQSNTCTSVVNLNGLLDVDAPSNSGDVTTSLTFQQEVQQVVPAGDPTGVTSTINVPDSFTVGEVEVALFVDAESQGRIAAKLTHEGRFASLVNRIGMDDRGAVGNTKNSFDVLLDDDEAEVDDIHLEPALGTIETLGVHQPDGRGKFFGDGITTDRRDALLFRLAGTDAAGPWDLFVGDFRQLGGSDNVFRRWALTLKNPCGPERYVGRALDLAPQAGICTLEFAAGATNLAIIATFAPGDEIVDYRVELIDPTQPGSGTLRIVDCAAGVTEVPISLAAASLDQNMPIITGDVDVGTRKFIGQATDNQPGDGGIVAVDLEPFAENLVLTSVTPDPPNGAGVVDFVVSLVDPQLNGRGYVRVTDACGWRRYVAVDIDANVPNCTGAVERSKRYFSDHDPLPIPDNSASGVVSGITVSDSDIVEDVDITFNITHPFDDDIEMVMTSPTSFNLFADIGSTGNDFRDTTLDDEAATPLPDSSSAAPFTGTFRPPNGPVLFNLDGVPASGTYALRVVDDKANDTGTFDSWSVRISSSTFPERFDGRAEDSEPLATGLCSVELIGAVNVALTVDDFDSGTPIARYSVDLVDSDAAGSATVRISDCGGNECDVPVFLLGLGTGDLNCDGAINAADIDPFVLALTDPAGYAAQYPNCDRLRGDTNGDGVVNAGDIDPFVDLLVGP